MTIRAASLSLIAASALCLVAMHALTGSAGAQGASSFASPAEARAELNRAQQQAREAAARAEKLTEQANLAERTADRSAREAAALAARIQQAEANIAASEARLALITDQRRVLDAHLAERQQPIVRLTGALQNMARRPLALSALRPGSLKDTVYVRAVLETTVPEIRGRTASLRAELGQSRRLEETAASALAELRAQQDTLENRRQSLAVMEQRQRRASREASGIAVRESERALALSEQARDLDDLVDELGAAASLRKELAALPGPIIRPARPGQSEVAEEVRPTPTPSATSPPRDFQLPVDGRILTGFGAAGEAGSVSSGLTLAPRSGAQIVSPGRGQVAFAGPYRGFGQIVIVEHANGWTSLITGLAKSNVTIGDVLVGGSPLGTAAEDASPITFELRREGEPVNPLEYMG